MALTGDGELRFAQQSLHRSWQENLYSSRRASRAGAQGEVRKELLSCCKVRLELRHQMQNTFFAAFLLEDKPNTLLVIPHHIY